MRRNSLSDAWVSPELTRVVVVVVYAPLWIAPVAKKRCVELRAYFMSFLIGLCREISQIKATAKLIRVYI